jgi:microcin C transport system permease protein
MFQYVIRRLLLMIPTFLAITFMVFLILQIAPDGPFERAVRQIKHADGQSADGISQTSDVTGDSSQLTPELLEKLRMQYGLDKPVIIRYMIWLGVWPKEYKSKVVQIGDTFRESIDEVSVSQFKNYLLQKYVKVEKDDNNELQVIETGVGLEFNLPDISRLSVDRDFNRKKYLHFQNEYRELPSNANMIETWYFSDWKIKKINEEKNTITLTKKKFNGILHGFLGYSDKKGKNVSTLIAERLHISAFFGLTSLIIAYMVCIPLGIMKALKHGQKFDVLSSIIVFVGYSIPGYALGVLLLSYLGGDVFPLHGWRSPNFDELSVIGKIKDQLHHAFLPILCYMVGSFATMTVLMKNSLMENLSQDYVRTAFAKGLSEKRVIFFHAVRNSLIPLATGIGGLIGVLLAGNYLIEKTFDIDGIGLLGLNALLDKDYNIIMGFLVIGVMIRLLGNLISDLTYALIDPRIRFK